MYIRFISAILCLILLAGCSGKQAKIETDAKAHFLLGVTYMRENKLSSALRELLRSVELNPKSARVYDSLAQVYQQKKAHSLALDAYQKALDLDPQPRYYNNIATLYLDMEQWDEAIDNFTRAAEDLLFARPQVSFTGMGYAYFRKGDLLRAEEACKEALEIAPSFPMAFFRLGEIYEAKGDLQKASEAYADALNTVPRSPLVNYNFALVSMKLDRPEKARAAFKLVMEQVPGTELARHSENYLYLLH